MSSQAEGDGRKACGIGAYSGMTRRAALLAGLGLLAGCASGSGPVGGPVTTGSTNNGRRIRSFGLLHSDGTVIVTPPGFTAGSRAWPAVVFLPMTDASGAESYQYFADAHAAAGTFVAIIPPGVTSRSDYSSGSRFTATIDCWADKAEKAVDRYADRYAVDRSRIGLAGYSLGGDLAWALSLKAPRSYRGAVIMGSRCGYRADDSLPVLAARDCRFAFTIGDREAQERAGGQAAARRLLAARGIPNTVVTLHGGHVRPPPPTFLALARYTLTGGALPAV